jgi:tetrahydromethanopterin S-methyltransferase subunit F
MEQIRINAVLGVCERQRELMLENRRLQKQLNRRFDDIGGMIGFTFAGLLILVCILL